MLRIAETSDVVAERSRASPYLGSPTTLGPRIRILMGGYSDKPLLNLAGGKECRNVSRLARFKSATGSPEAFTHQRLRCLERSY